MRKRKIEQQEKNFSDINNGLQSTNQKALNGATGAKFFRD
jgi:hypothetical protein